jgi:protein-disulfide isomerase
MRKILIAMAAISGVSVFIGPAATAQTKMPAITAEDHVLGKPDAPVAIIEYASLTCPHCAAFEKESLPKLKSDWIDTGKAKLVFRDFPLDRLALAASLIATCAPPDHYFSFIETFFGTQENWARAANPTDALKGIARLGGMNGSAVDICLADKTLQDKIVQTELAAKNEYGVDSTPTFFILGVGGDNKLVGDQPYDDFTKALLAASPKS